MPPTDAGTARPRRDLRRVPTATYRVQLHAGFTLDDAAELVPQLAELGVSHLYCSPYLASAPGSTHGYDVVDHTRVDAEAGGEEAHARLAAALRAAGMGQVLDIVPNHMTVGTRNNPSWWDVLTFGAASDRAGWFDIDWDRHQGRVLLPVLDETLADALSRGELTVAEEDGRPLLRYRDQAFPLAPGTVPDDQALPGTATRALLDAQHYLLAHWQDRDLLNYRRFFDVTALAGLRVEDPEVFEQTHRLVLDWVSSGVLDGLRVDHPDGLADPAAYLDDIAAAAPGAWVVVEKILEPGERLPDWPVDGTTGYDAITDIQQVLVDPGAEGELTSLYRELTGEEADFAAVVRDAKVQVVREVLVPEVDHLARLLSRVAAARPPTAMAAPGSIADTVRALLAGYEVYRTYVTYKHGASAEDRHRIESAVAAARSADPAPDPAVLDLLRGVLLAEHDARGALEEELLTRWQQTTGPVMAKAVEDTAFYRYHRLVALNEVGGDPGVVGRAIADFHDSCAQAQRDWPLRMTALTTHDTKRSEDARCRLIALAESPAEWAAFARSWFERHEQRFAAGRVDRNTAYLLLQTLVAAHPLSADRAVAYLEKASREAKRHTSWTDPDEQYDEALRAFVLDVVGDETTQQDIGALLADIGPAATAVSLAAKLLQLTMPGVPDVYQGAERWDNSLVDPDNRRPVDHQLTARMLAELPSLAPMQIRDRAAEGMTKLHVVRAALTARRSMPEAFGAGGDYEPLLAAGERADHCVAFCRGGAVVTAVTRLPRTVEPGWSGTELTLPRGRWRDVLTGAEWSGGAVALDSLLDVFPVALLVREDRP